jgi:3'-phosphoadenosine 5'-phosphosulfate sulfotransferase (PAPS reductase)/FAD synthetase
MTDSTRHILCMSGGKDSTALALYMRDRVPNMECVFCDTDKELTETYEYLNRVEAFLGKKIVRLNAKAGFDHWFEVYGGYPALKRRGIPRRRMGLEAVSRESSVAS